MFRPQYSWNAFSEKEEDFDNIFSKISEIIGTVSEDMDNSFAGIGDKELRDIKIFRHAVLNKSIQQSQRER